MYVCVCVYIYNIYIYMFVGLFQCKHGFRFYYNIYLWFQYSKSFYTSHVIHSVTSYIKPSTRRIDISYGIE